MQQNIHRPEHTRQEPSSDTLQVIAGPIIRNLNQQQMVLWLATSQAQAPQCRIETGRGDTSTCNSDSPEAGSEPEQLQLKYRQQHLCFQVGVSAFIHHLIIDFTAPLNPGSVLHYDLMFEHEQQEYPLSKLAPHLTYPGETRFRVQFSPNIKQLFHGSCRKPHHDEADALVRVDEHLAQCLRDQVPPPSALLMSGDQVYVDDVAGPMLQAIHQVIDEFGLFNEDIPGANVTNFNDLLNHQDCFYQRTELLPLSEANEEVQEEFFKAKRKPIFTSVNAQNHLITASEVLAMYFLIWSDMPWQAISLNDNHIREVYREKFNEEQNTVEAFARNLPKVRRALAHIPVYMIFDDHDITDDWNLTRGWEEIAYGNEFSRRIIGNALLGYWLCQGLGNNPNRYGELVQSVSKQFTPDGIRHHDDLIEALFNWDHWHFTINYTPNIVVLDSRTHRWRSEEDADKPSGLMDWERLQELRKSVTGKEQIIIVSAAPIFGVKLIEAIQKVFTFFGQALTVDAENWMAHQGTAKVLMDIFRHEDTANQFIILSGDVHYSFVYDIRLYFQKQSPNIHQITASGIKNQFPAKLIRILDKLNRYLYGPKSPLNWFTKRRRMKITTRYPNRENKSESLVSKSAIGLLELPEDRSRPIAKLLPHDHQDVEFK